MNEKKVNPFKREVNPSLPHIVDTTHLKWNPKTWKGQYFFRFDNHMAIGIEIPPLADNFARWYSKMYLISTSNLDKAVASGRFVKEDDCVTSLSRNERDEISCIHTGKTKDQFIQYLQLIKQYKEGLKLRRNLDKEFISRWRDIKEEIPDIEERYRFIDFNWDSIINKVKYSQVVSAPFRTLRVGL